jgi:hypothetical protein
VDERAREPDHEVDPALPRPGPLPASRRGERAAESRSHDPGLTVVRPTDSALPVAPPTPDGPVEAPACPEQGDDRALCTEFGDAGRTGPPTLADLPVGRLALPRWVGPLFLTAAAGLVPWIIFLAMSLPRRAEAANYRLAWVGFDVGILGVLTALGWLAYRRSTWTEMLAACAATLLVVDAWFDVITAPHPPERLLALASALIFELPFAGLCVWLARNAELVRRRGMRRLGSRVIELEERLRMRRHRSDLEGEQGA